MDSFNELVGNYGEAIAKMCFVYGEEPELIAMGDADGEHADTAWEFSNGVKVIKTIDGVLTESDSDFAAKWSYLTDFVAVEPDMENNAEEWWDNARDKYPELIREIEGTGYAIIQRCRLASLKAIPGWDSGPSFARYPLVVREPSEWPDAGIDADPGVPGPLA